MLCPRVRPVHSVGRRSRLSQEAFPRNVFVRTGLLVPPEDQEPNAAEAMCERSSWLLRSRSRMAREALSPSAATAGSASRCRKSRLAKKCPARLRTEQPIECHCAFLPEKEPAVQVISEAGKSGGLSDRAHRSRPFSSASSSDTWPSCSRFPNTRYNRRFVRRP